MIKSGRSEPGTIVQFCRFIVTGMVNTLFGYSVFASLIFLGASASVALFLTYVVGVPFNFVTTGKMVFGGMQWARFPRFVLAYVIVFIFNATLYRVIAMGLANPFVIQAICIPLVAVFSFVLFKSHVFQTQA